MTGFPDLEQDEVLIEPGQWLVLRNVHPAFVDSEAGVVTRLAFTPNSGDGGCMSVVQKIKSEPVDAFLEYTTRFGLDSAGVWGVTTAEVCDIGSRSVDDEATAPRRRIDLPVGHAYVDFRDLNGSRGGERKRATALKELALARGCLYANPEVEQS